MFNMIYLGVYIWQKSMLKIRLFTQKALGNYWAFAVLSGPDFIANLSDGLKIMDPSFITCDDIGKLIVAIS